MDMETLMNLFKMKAEKDKLDGAASLYANLSKDGVMPVTSYKKMKDDGKLKLHPARFNRAPISDLAEYYHLVPIKHKPIIRQMNLEHSGSENAVSDKTIEILHDRTKSLNLKHFYSGNLCVAAKGRKEFVTVEDGSMGKVLDYDWDSPFTIQSLQEAVLNFLVINANLYPYDTTGFSLMRILIKYRWIANAENQTIRRNVIMTFFETVSRLNATRANNSKAPLSYDKQLEVIRDILIKNAITPDFPLATIPKHQPSGNRDQGSQGGGSGSRQSNPGGRGGRSAGFSDKKKPLMVNNNRVCYTFNNKNGLVCQNTQTAEGCKNEKESFAHVCNVYVAEKKAYCLSRQHSRKDHV